MLSIFADRHGPAAKSFVARARLPQIQTGAGCCCGSRALATKAVQFQLVRPGIADFSHRRPAGRALQQIKDKGYARPYLADGRPIQLIGVEFSRSSRTVVGFDTETL